jgi:hypothetical protein
MRGATITLKFPGKCRDCGATLNPGDRARWYGRGRVYGLECHPQKPTGRARSGQKLVWWGGKQVPGTHCEDAPCCGCCGPGSDDPAYQPDYNPSESYDEREGY